MDTNTIMLIALAIIVVLSALAIWLANRGSGVEEPPHEHDADSIDSDDVVVERDTVVASKPKITDSKTTSSVKTTDSMSASDVKVVDNTKKAPVIKPPVGNKDNVNQVRDAKNPPRKG